MSAAPSEDKPTGASHSAPLVSVCTPVLNGGELVVRAIRSALDQEYSTVEIIVVDDASTDGTPARLKRSFGGRVTVIENSVRRGQAHTTNRAVGYAAGEFIKFLHHDDKLDEDSVSTMMEPLVERSSVGLVFARRRLEVAPEADEGRAWQEAFSAPHKGFSGLKRFNRGEMLLADLIANGLRSNWIGEPSNVMVRRSSFVTAGGFDPRMRHWTDFDLWLRLLTRCDAAFIDRELSTYRRSGDSLTARNTATGEAWLDRLWMIENLMASSAVVERYPELARLRTMERRMAWRTAVRGMLRMRDNSAPPRPWLHYLSRRAIRRPRGDR